MNQGQAISPSGRRCWLGLRISEFPQKCSWYQTDEKHIEDYFSDLGDTDWVIFIYEASPGATKYSRVYQSPADVIRCFQEKYEEWDGQFEWMNAYELTCSQECDFPTEIVPMCKRVEGKSCYVLSYPELDAFEFTLKKKGYHFNLEVHFSRRAR